MVFAPPKTQTQLSHAVAIMFNNDIVGAINEWSPGMTRMITELWELGGSTPGAIKKYQKGPGEPYEKVPGNVSGMRISVKRYDVYPKQMEFALGTFLSPGEALTRLANQNEPFDIREAWAVPAGLTQPAAGYSNEYEGCWFSDLGRTLSSTGDRVVNVNASIEYTSKRRI